MTIDRREAGYFAAVSDLFAFLEAAREVNDGSLVLCGMNPHFDRAFLDIEWEWMHSKRPPWGHRVYDLHSLALQYLGLTDINVQGLNSNTLSEQLGVDPEDDIHCATGGVEWACRCFARIHNNLSMMRESLA